LWATEMNGCVMMQKYNKPGNRSHWTIGLCFMAATFVPAGDIYADEDKHVQSLQKEVAALKLQVSELQQIVRLLSHHMKVGSEQNVIEADPGLEVAASETACSKLVERLRTKLHAMKAFGYTEKHPDVRQLTGHLDSMSNGCSKDGM